MNGTEVAAEGCKDATVLIIYTGGTIGMQPSGDGYIAVESIRQLLEKQLGNLAGRNLPDWELLELPEPIDSSNLQPADWSVIARALEVNWLRYAGFIILHGTDTMAYSASALSFMLQGTDKPVIFTGSQIPLAETGNDALNNLIQSLRLAVEPSLSEVCICFGNRLLRGNRSRKVRSTGLDAYDSPNFPWLGETGIHTRLNTQLLLSPGTPRFSVPDFDSQAVCLLPVFPGITADFASRLLGNPRLRGVVLQTYGVGNLPDADPALTACLASASETMVLVNITQCMNGAVYQGAYATGASLNRAGVVSGGDMTPEAAFSKLHVLLASGADTDEVRNAMRQSLAGELSS